MSEIFACEFMLELKLNETTLSGTLNPILSDFGEAKPLGKQSPLEILSVYLFF